MNKTLKADLQWSEAYTGYWVKRFERNHYAIRKRIQEDIYHLYRNGEEIARSCERKELIVKAIRDNYGTSEQHETTSKDL